MALTVPGDPQQGEGEKPDFNSSFDDLRARLQRQQSRTGNLLESWRQSRQVPPDKAARVLNLGAKMGLDADLLYDNLDEAERLAADKEFNAEEFRRKSPKVAEWYRKSQFHIALGRKDMEALGSVERTFARRDDPLRPLMESEIENDVKVLKSLKISKRDRDAASVASTLEGAPLPGTLTDEQIDSEARSEILEDERFVESVEKMGFGETMSRKFRDNPSFMLPFIGGAEDAERNIELYQAAKAIEAGNSTPEQQYLVRRYGRLAAAMERRGGQDVAGLTAEIMAGLVPVLGEFAATGPGYRIAKVGVEKTLRAALSKVMMNRVGGLLPKAGGVAAGAFVQGVLMEGPQGIAGGIAERMLPGISIDPSKEGELRVALDPDAADGFGTAIAKTLGSQFVQTLSERAGAGVEVPVGALKRVIATRWLKLHPTEGVDGFLKKVATATGWNGVVGEIFEERVAELGEAGLMIEPYKPPTGDQLLAEAMTFAIPGAVGSLSRAAARRLNRQETDLAQKAFVSALATLAQESEIKKGSDATFEGAVKEAVRGPNDTFYPDARKFDAFMSEQKDENGKPLNVKEFVEEKLGITKTEYEDAVARGGMLTVPAEKYAAHLSNPEWKTFFQEELKTNPLFLTPEESKEALAEKEQERVEMLARASLTEERVEKLSRRLARKEAEAEYEAIKSGDIIAKSADLEGMTADERAARFGITDEEYKAAVSDARVTRAKAREKIERGEVPDYIKEAAKADIFRSEVAKISERSKAQALKKLLKSEATAEAKALEREADLDEEGEILVALEDVAADKKREALYKTQAKELGKRVRTMLEEAGFKMEAAQYQKVTEAAFLNLARQAGVEPQELFKKYKLSVRRNETTEEGDFFQPAYHGSPHKFDKFSLQKIGTGEGAQAYGWGLYFAGKKDVAEYYRKTLALKSSATSNALFGLDGGSGSGVLHINDSIADDVGNDSIDGYYARDIRSLVNAGVSPEAARSQTIAHLKRSLSAKNVDEDYKKLVESQIELAKNAKLEIKSPGRLYTVDIPEDGDYLDWDKPFSEQSEKVKAALRTVKTELVGDSIQSFENASGYDIYRAAVRDNGHSAEAGSKALLAAGIPGIRYLDQGSRSEGQGSHNYVLFDDKLVKITSYEQGNRGSLSIGPNREMAIDFFKTADRTTFLHEMGHFYLEVIGDIVELPNASQRIRDDYAKILKYLGVEKRSDIKPGKGGAHEKWAETIEAYFLKGEAPTKGLLGAFHRIKEWFKAVYEAAGKVLGIEMSPEIRGVMDRVFATDAEIDEATKAEGLQLLFDDAKKAGMNDAQAKAYAELGAKQKAEADNSLRREMMRDLRAQDTEGWKEIEAKVKEEVTRETNEMRVYKALSVFKTGALPDGTQVMPEGSKLRIARDLIPPEYLPSMPKETYAVTGLIPDEAARIVMYPNASEMFQDIGSAEAKDDHIARVTEERMKQYGEPLTEEELEDAANSALHGPVYREIMAAQLQTLAKQNAEAMRLVGTALLGRVPAPQAIKEKAQITIAGTPLKAINPKTYQGAERAAAKRLQKAYAAGKLAEAIDAQVDQLWNGELYIHATEALEARRKFEDKVAKDYFKGDEKLAKSRDLNYIHAIRAMLSRVNLGPAGKTAEEHLKATRDTYPEVYDSLVADVEAVPNGKSFLDLTYDEFKALAAATDRMWIISRGVNRFTREGKIEEIKDIEAELIEAERPLREALHAKPKRTATKWDKFIKALNGLKALLRRSDSWARSMDLGADRGKHRQILTEPVKDAANAHNAEFKRLKKAFLGILRPIEASFNKNQPIDCSDMQGSITQFSDFNELFGAILHRGNKSNFQKLLRGYKWGDWIDDTEELDTSRWDRFEKRMQDSGILTAAHYEAAQKVWDLFESLKPRIWKVHYEIEGFYPDEVAAEEFTNQFGTFRGGYVPAKADPHQSYDAEARESARIINEDYGASFALPGVSRGSVRRRVESFARPLTLDVRFVVQHLDWASRYINIEPAVRQAGRLLRRRELAESIDAIEPGVMSHMLMPWLRRAAQQQVEQPMESHGGRWFASLISRFRSTVGSTIMQLNVQNALQQYTGISVLLSRVKGQYVWGALTEALTNGAEMGEAISAKSSFMADRWDNDLAAMNNDMKDILLNPTAYEKLRDYARQNSYILQRFTQSFVDRTAWRAGYDQAIANGETDAAAIKIADSIVRETQGSNAPEDISNLEASNAFIRLFLQFYGYWNTIANNGLTEAEIAVRTTGFKPSAGRLFFVYFSTVAIPTIVASAIIKAGGGGLDDDEEDGYTDEVLAMILGAQAQGIFAMVPGGQAGNVFINSFTKANWYDDNLNVSPVIGAIERMAKAPASVYNSIFGEGGKAKGVKDGLTLVSLLSGIPLGGPIRPISYLTGIAADEIEPSGPIDFTRGIITGRPGLR